MFESNLVKKNDFVTEPEGEGIRGWELMKHIVVPAVYL
jgi:hypothetical protein